MTSLRRLRRSESPRARLILFPHAGGSAPSFAPMAARLPAWIDAVGVQYPGRLDRYFDRRAPDMNALAEEVLHDLPCLGRSDVPHVVMGHSMGAAVALEMGRGLAPGILAGLIASAAAPPTVKPRVLLHTLDDAALLREIRAMDDAHADVYNDPELRRIFFPILRHDIQIAETHQAVITPITCPIMVLGGDSDSTVTLGELRQWQQIAAGDFFLRFWEGGHFYHPDHTAEVANAVAAFLSYCINISRQPDCASQNAITVGPHTAKSFDAGSVYGEGIG